MPVDDIWRDTSYQDRFGIFCERLVAEQLYDAACATSPRRSRIPSRSSWWRALTGGTSPRRSMPA
ncbi:hypothetical protein [Streptomyces sp. P17]|uniref:hypothetical protein n=1 Tax=Streptomyces sp. P17 TaxID=3074716 RepID=UPI0028F41FE1|nr:hypothetical protein [Streptomyces sp. P17]MDT9699539.1 hypothetical protein [Streptomyces sp. P17]